MKKNTQFTKNWKGSKHDRKVRISSRRQQDFHDAKAGAYKSEYLFKNFDPCTLGAFGKGQINGV